MQDDSYLTLARSSEGLYKEKGSKFLAFAYRVATEDDIKNRQEELRKKYYDARHHCYAYILGKDQDRYRANDDGEPNHSAGDPILGQIRSHNLTNVLIVVVRYFGGTKLGVSGLITAYKEAAADAIAHNEIITEIVHERISFTFDYLGMNDVMRLVKDYELEIVDQHFDMECQMTLSVRQNLADEVTEKLRKIEQVKLDDETEEEE